ncbi:MAG TPA: hypothetical protein ENK55_07320 [Actinobacteria bacterium]|nr:hypothetical protein [Actinomycetota bacterium]
MIRLLAAASAAAAVGFLAVGARGRDPFARIGDYLRPRTLPQPTPTTDHDRLAAAGLDWTAADLRVRRAVAVALGVAVGALLAQGDLFLAGTGRSTPASMALGGAAGWLLLSMWITTRIQRRALHLRLELPVLADALALGVLAGDPVVAAIAGYVERSRGVGAEELRRVLDDHESGTALPEALNAAARSTAEPEAARLYGLLAHAHVTGGRLAETLAAYAADVRAGLARSMTAESGRRAITSYGPVLALMVPVALLFLLYPTLVGLRSLATGN